MQHHPTSNGVPPPSTHVVEKPPTNADRTRRGATDKIGTSRDELAEIKNAVRAATEQFLLDLDKGRASKQ